MKLFEKISKVNTVLPIDKFKLFTDLEFGFDLSKIKPELKEKLISDANNFLNLEIPSLPASLYRQFYENGNRTNYETPYFFRRRALIALTLGEAIEDKGRFTDKIIDYIWSILEESTWVIPAHNIINIQGEISSSLCTDYTSEVRNIDLFSAETSAVISFSYYLLKEKLEKTVPVVLCKRILYELDRKIFIPYLRYIHMWWMGFLTKYVNNWNPWIVSNILTAACLAEYDDEKRRAILERSMVLLDNFIDTYQPSGGCTEGPGYWDAAGAALFDCLELIYDLTGGEVNIFDEPLIKNMGEYIMKVNLLDSLYTNFADAHPKISHNYSAIARFGRRVKSKELESFGRLKFYESLGESYSESDFDKLLPAFTVPNFHHFRYMKKLLDIPKPNDGFMPPKVSFVDDVQVVVMKESSDGKHGFTFAIKGGTNAEQHNHNDVGTFILYCDGKPIFIDYGVGTYTKFTFSDIRYTLFGFGSNDHALPTINGKEQFQSFDAKTDFFEFDKEKQNVRMGLTLAYGKKAGLSSYERMAALSDKCLIIKDSISFAESGEIIFNFPLFEKPKEMSDGKIIFENRVSLQYDLSLKAEIVDIDIKDTGFDKDWGKNVIYKLRLITGKDIKNKDFIFTIKR